MACLTSYLADTQLSMPLIRLQKVRAGRLARKAFLNAWGAELAGPREG